MDVTGLESNSGTGGRPLPDRPRRARPRRFIDADASVWNESRPRPRPPLGTLDHLRHPLLALENAARMLRPGGYLALELQTLSRDDDGPLCRYVGDDTSTTCRWFIGKEALRGMLSDAGFDRMQIVLDWRARISSGLTWRASWSSRRRSRRARPARLRADGRRDPDAASRPKAASADADLRRPHALTLSVADPLPRLGDAPDREHRQRVRLRLVDPRPASPDARLLVRLRRHLPALRAGLPDLHPDLARLVGVLRHCHAASMAVTLARSGRCDRSRSRGR